MLKSNFYGLYVTDAGPKQRYIFVAHSQVVLGLAKFIEVSPFAWKDHFQISVILEGIFIFVMLFVWKDAIHKEVTVEGIFTLERLFI